MNTPRDNEKTTAEFRLAMLEKLNDNNHKAHWNEAGIKWLYDKLDEEYSELIAELHHIINRQESRISNIGKTSIVAAMKECADVANMAMMIWDNLQRGIIEGSSDTEYLEPEKETD
jgi:DNA-binding ferritin-like protein